MVVVVVGLLGRGSKGGGRCGAHVSVGGRIFDASYLAAVEMKRTLKFCL